MNTDKKFTMSVNNCVQLYADTISNEYITDMYHYVVLGQQPGGMFSAIFANDVITASCHSHPLNEWQQLYIMFRWIKLVAPSQCWGSYAKVAAWCKLTQEKRDEICEHAGIKMTAWEVLSAEY